MRVNLRANLAGLALFYYVPFKGLGFIFFALLGPFVQEPSEARRVVI